MCGRESLRKSEIPSLPQSKLRWCQLSLWLFCGRTIVKGGGLKESTSVLQLQDSQYTSDEYSSRLIVCGSRSRSKSLTLISTVPLGGYRLQSFSLFKNPVDVYRS